MCLSMSYVFILQHYLRQLEPCLSKSIECHGKQNRHLCHNVEIMWVCKKNECWKTILLDSGPSTKDDFHLRWEESCKCNCVLFTSDMTCTPCKEGFLSLQQSGQTEVHLFSGWWSDDTDWDWSKAWSTVHNGGAVHCSCRTDWNTRHCFYLYFVQTNVSMWHLTYDGIEVMPF